MAIAETRIHLICGFCGRNDMWEYSLNDKKEVEEHEASEVVLHCRNCSSITGLEEIANKEGDKRYGK